jgi:L-threonylcarbamoyladenylate synthase
MLEEALGIKVKTAAGESDTPRAPGMKYKHYCPSVPLTYVCKGSETALKAKFKELRIAGRPVIIALTESDAKDFAAENFEVLIAGRDIAEAAKNLYALIREAEERFDYIFAIEAENIGIGRAVNNRLLKASGGNVL